MRKVLVCGAAFAATCVSAVAVPAGAHADPPVPEPSTSAPATPPTGETGAPTGGAEPGGTGSARPSAPAGTPPPAGPDGEPDQTVTASAVMVTPELPKFRTYAYGTDPAQKVDAYWRNAGPTATPRPAVLILHGGYWMAGDKGGGWKYIARRLTEEGFVVLSANYRLAPKAQWPAQRDDAMSALEFIKRNARLWNADPQRVAVLGSSAGGHLATQLGTFGSGARQVRGVVAMSPPNNPYLAYKDGAKPEAKVTQRKLRGAVQSLVGCEPNTEPGTEPSTGPGAEPGADQEECWARLDDASTLTHVSSGDAPMLLMHASGDFVPATQSTGLVGALRAAGVQATLKRVKGELHATQMMEEPGVYPTIVSWLKARLKAD